MPSTRELPPPRLPAAVTRTKKRRKNLARVADRGGKANTNAEHRGAGCGGTVGPAPFAVSWRPPRRQNPFLPPISPTLRSLLRKSRPSLRPFTIRSVKLTGEATGVAFRRRIG